MLSARFRDIPQIIFSAIQVLFFLTPILWSPDLLRSRAYLVDWNPFYHLIEVVRAPLLGTAPAALTYASVLAITGLNLMLTGLLFTRYRGRLAYWV